MKQNVKLVVGAVALFAAGGIFATVLLSAAKTQYAQADLKDDIYRYAEVSTEAGTAQQASAQAVSQTASQTAEQPAEQAALNGVDVKVELTNTWPEGSLTVQQFSVVVTNNSSETISDWKGVIEFDDSVKENLNGWGGASYVAGGSSVTITPTEPWSKEIAPGDSKKDFGFQLRSDSGVNFKSAKITSNIGDFSAKATVPEPVPVETDGSYDGVTPVAKHGKLSVSGTKIVDSSGEPVILQGVSTHGISWFPQYVNKDAFRTLRDTMGVNTVRLALYSSDGEGYTADMHKKVSEGVEYAKELGMYVIIDWHILANGNPNTDKERAKTFFTEMTGKYKDYDNVIYEICNEPNGGVTWDNDIKPYAEEMISLIRAQDNDAIIIVGTPTWSQDVDIAAKNPITGQSNIVYALHFYAATHRAELRNKVTAAVNAGLPVFVSEFGISEASGSGGIDEGEATTWINFLRKNGIGYVCWNLSNKNESCALIKSDCQKTSDWTDNDLTQEGLWVKNTYNN